MAELTDLAAGFAIKDATEEAQRRDRRHWREKDGLDYTEVARMLRGSGFVIVKKEQDG